MPLITIHIDDKILIDTARSALSYSHYWCKEIDFGGTKVGPEMRWKITPRDERVSMNPVVTWPGLIRGAELMARKNPHQFGLMISEKGDAITGDVLIQYAVFGEEVYQ